MGGLSGPPPSSTVLVCAPLGAKKWDDEEHDDSHHFGKGHYAPAAVLPFYEGEAAEAHPRIMNWRESRVKPYFS